MEVWAVLRREDSFDHDHLSDEPELFGECVELMSIHSSEMKAKKAAIQYRKSCCDWDSWFVVRVFDIDENYYDDD